eukprot:5518693-Pyramimonas_sp.AAC.1
MESNMASNMGFSVMQESFNKHNNYVELRDRITTIERHMRVGSDEANEEALLAKIEVNILEVQSSVDSASIRSSLPAVPRWFKGKFPISSGGSFTGGGSY